ncbi:hypothetical protein PF049_04045 [Erythrobacteraceae bacterium WH01K]|nr:hypothetical protein PF049_04045 [Erythrobacteraceae bacterium WH01K]
MTGTAIIALALVLAVAGIFTLRISWGRVGRDVHLNLIGWSLLAAGTIVGAMKAGAWGMAVTAAAAMIAAIALLLVAAARSDAKGRSARRLPRPACAASLQNTAPAWRGAITFALAGPVSLLAVVALALAVRTRIVGAGGEEADANVAVLGLVPLLWPFAALAVTMPAGRLKGAAALLAIGLCSLPLAMTGGASL